MQVFADIENGELIKFSIQFGDQDNEVHVQEFLEMVVRWTAENKQKAAEAKQPKATP